MYFHSFSLKITCIPFSLREDAVSSKTPNHLSGMSSHIGLKLGLAAGFIHHFLIQYPSQANVFTTMYAFIKGNVVFFVHTLSFRECFMFALIYVFIFHPSC